MTTTPTLSPDQVRPLLVRLDDIASALDDLYTSSDGEVTSTAQHMEAFLTNEREVCLEALAWWMRELAATDLACKEEIARLQEVRHRVGRRDAFAKQTIRDLLKDMGTRKIDLGTFAISLRVGSQSVVALVGAPEGLVDILDDRFQRVVPEKVELDKKEIAKALKAGESVPFHALERGPDTVVVK